MKQFWLCEVFSMNSIQFKKFRQKKHHLQQRTEYITQRGLKKYYETSDPDWKIVVQVLYRIKKKSLRLIRNWINICYFIKKGWNTLLSLLYSSISFWGHVVLCHISEIAFEKCRRLKRQTFHHRPVIYCQLYVTNGAFICCYSTKTFFYEHIVCKPRIH